MSFNPTAWGAPMGPSAPQTPGTPGENPILAALARAIGNNPAGPQFSGGGSLNYGQAPTPTTLPTAFSQPPAPTQDYDTQIQQNQMRQRLAMSLMQNQTRGGPFAALSNAIAGYYGAKNFKGAEKGELDIAAAKKADEAAKYGSLAKQFGLDAGGVGIDSPQMLQLASALSGQKYAQENPPITVIPEGGFGIDRTGKEVARGNPKPDRIISGGNGTAYNADTNTWLQGPAFESPEDKSKQRVAEAGQETTARLEARQTADDAKIREAAPKMEATAKMLTDAINDPLFPQAVGFGKGARASVEAQYGKETALLTKRLETVIPTVLMANVQQLKSRLPATIVQMMRDTMPTVNDSPPAWYDWLNNVYIPQVNAGRDAVGLPPLNLHAGPTQPGHQTVMDTPPDPAQHKDAVIIDHSTQKSYRSDGKKWVEIP